MTEYTLKPLGSGFLLLRDGVPYRMATPEEVELIGRLGGSDGR